MKVIQVFFLSFAVWILGLTPSVAHAANRSPKPIHSYAYEISKAEIAVAPIGLEGSLLLGSKTLLYKDAARFTSTTVLQFVATNTPWDDLAAYRAQNGMPVAGSAADGATAARLKVGGQTFYGRNAEGLPIDIKVNAQTATHAEASVFSKPRTLEPPVRPPRCGLIVPCVRRAAETVAWALYCEVQGLMK